MERIGERAAEVIRGRCVLNRTTLGEELDILGVSRTVLHNWEKGIFDPTSYYLQQLALAGYDVNYILTGKENWR
jgi:DNA-binding XRE family transcriptional regulator